MKSAEVVPINGGGKPPSNSGAGGGGGAPGPERPFNPADNDGNADDLAEELFLHECYTTLLLQPAGWMEWTPERGWTLVDKGYIEAVVRRFFRDRAALDRSGKLKPFKVSKKFVAEVCASLEAKFNRKGEGLIAPTYLAAPNHNAAVMQQTWGPPNRLILVANGVINCMTQDLLPPTPALFSAGACPVPFDPRANCDRWIAFLQQLFGDDGEAIDAFQEFCGYCLSDMTHLQRCLWIAGPPGCGKGTALRVLSELLGTSNTTTAVLSDLSGESRFSLEHFIGKKIVTFPEAIVPDRGDRKQLLTRILSIVGGDPISIDRKHDKHWRGRLPARLLFASNELPELADSAAAMVRRTLLLQIKKTFAEKPDPHLEQKLIMELPGILLWALEGLRRLLVRGDFIQPPSGASAVRMLRDLASPQTAFLRDCTEMDKEDDASTPRTDVDTVDLYRARLAWDREQGNRKGLKQTDFGRQLKAVMPGMERKQQRRNDGSGGRHYVYPGLSLNSYGLDLINKKADLFNE